MAGNVNSSQKHCSRTIFFRVFLKFSCIVAVSFVSFLAGHLLNSIYPSNHKEVGTEVNPIEQRSTSDVASHIKTQLLSSLRVENLEENLRYFSKEPHLAGSKRNNDLAQVIAKKWKEHGFDQVEMAKYNVLMTSPRKDMKSKVEIYCHDQVVFTSQSYEKILRKDEKKAKGLPFFLGFSPSGVVERDVVYANFGTVKDFRKLKAMGVSVKDKIVLVRQGRVFRGNKVSNAVSHGASGALIYTDPAEFAPEGNENTFPRSWWLPGSGIQRGTSMGATGPGDPLTPGFPSVDGIYRQPLNESGLPKIPAFELSYKDAEEILRRMKGRKAPKNWQGGLRLTYHLGPGFRDENLSLRMEVNNVLETKTIYNVIGQIRGAEEPDRYVLMGNHRDAWVFGAADAVSGTSVLMELSRGLGELLKTGWRPRRTIMLCSWDAEEVFVVGSAEWVEENARILQDRAVGYLNMDVAINGNFTLNVDANPLLQEVAVSLTKEVCDPTVSHSCKSMYDVMLERDVTKHVNGSVVTENLSFGSDYAPFYQFTGVSCVDWSYIFGGMYGIRRSYPVYHSVHDTYYWMKTFVDPEFKTHLAVAKFAAIFLLKLSESELLPFNTTTYGELLRSKAHSLKSIASARLESHNISTAAFSRAVENFARISREFQINKFKGGRQQLRMLNDQMMQLEKAFIQTTERNDHKQLRHVIYGPNLSNLYGGVYFPRVHFALIKAEETGDWKLVEKEISLLTYAINSAANVLKPI